MSAALERALEALSHPTQRSEEPSYPAGPEPGVEDLPSAVFQALGQASACWENLVGAGVFEASRAVEVGLSLIRWIEARYDRRTP